eukprot:5332896-Prymnesium_polylepis.1
MPPSTEAGATSATAHRAFLPPRRHYPHGAADPQHPERHPVCRGQRRDTGATAMATDGAQSTATQPSRPVVCAQRRFEPTPARVGTQPAHTAQAA